MKILAGIVTYNRKLLLKRCIESVMSQILDENVKIDILVINNSSTDGTEVYLKKNNIKFVTLENRGAVFGWEYLIEFSKKNNYELLWLMDDDGYPEEKSINYLIKFYKSNKNLAILNSLVLNEKNSNELSFDLPKLNKNNNPIIFSIPRKISSLIQIKKNFNKDYYNFCHLFNGSLFSVKYLKSVGNVNTRYKIYGEELDLFYRMRKVGKCYTVFNSIHFHPKFSSKRMNPSRSNQWLFNTFEINYKYLDHYQIRNFLVLMKYSYLFFNKLDFLNFFRNFYKALSIIIFHQYKND